MSLSEVEKTTSLLPSTSALKVGAATAGAAVASSAIPASTAARCFTSLHLAVVVFRMNDSADQSIEPRRRGEPPLASTQHGHGAASIRLPRVLPVFVPKLLFCIAHLRPGRHRQRRIRGPLG